MLLAKTDSRFSLLQLFGFEIKLGMGVENHRVLQNPRLEQVVDSRGVVLRLLCSAID